MPWLIHSHHGTNSDRGFLSVFYSSGELQGSVERIVPVHLNQSPPGMFPYFSQKSGIICNWGLVPQPMTLNTISDFQSSWLFPLFPSAGWKRDCQGKRKAWPNGPNTPGYSFLRNFSVPCVGPLFSVLECPFLRVGAWLRSIGGLCLTTCTANPLEKGSPTGGREDLNILKLPSLPGFGSEGGEVPSKLSLNPSGCSDSSIFAANSALTQHCGTRRKPQGSKISLFPAAPLKLSPLLGPETHPPQQLQVVLSYLFFLWSPIQTPLGGWPVSFSLAQFVLLQIWLGFLDIFIYLLPTEKLAACSILPEMFFGSVHGDMRICLVQSWKEVYPTWEQITVTSMEGEFGTREG